MVSLLQTRSTRIVLSMALCLAAGCQYHVPKRISYQREKHPKGWKGKTYHENGKLVAEEYDVVGQDDRIDLWRYYREGKMISEASDRDADGKVDYKATYNPATGFLESVVRDTNFDNTMDFWITATGRNVWRQTWDRNQDGAADYRFIFTGAPEQMAALKLDWHEVLDLSAHIPRIHWREVAVDKDRDGHFDTWARFAGGNIIARGVGPDQQGQPARWASTARPDAPAPTEEPGEIRQAPVPEPEPVPMADQEDSLSPEERAPAIDVTRAGPRELATHEPPAAPEPPKAKGPGFWSRVRNVFQRRPKEEPVEWSREEDPGEFNTPPPPRHPSDGL